MNARFAPAASGVLYLPQCAQPALRASIWQILLALPPVMTVRAIAPFARVENGQAVRMPLALTVWLENTCLTTLVL